MSGCAVSFELLFFTPPPPWMFDYCVRDWSCELTMLFRYIGRRGAVSCEMNSGQSMESHRGR